MIKADLPVRFLSCECSIYCIPSHRGESDKTDTGFDNDRKLTINNTMPDVSFFNDNGFPYAVPSATRPRLLLHGLKDLGQVEHLAPAVVDLLEKYSVVTLDLTTMYDSTAVRSPEDMALMVRDFSLTLLY